jgi:hypothetical protein
MAHTSRDRHDQPLLNKDLAVHARRVRPQQTRSLCVQLALLERQRALDGCPITRAALTRRRVA